MPAAKSDKATGGESPATPTITATRGGVVIGTDFLPEHIVTVRITRPGEDISDYLAYTTDRNGCLCAYLPATALRGMLRITATDHRRDPDGMCGRLWSNIYILSTRDS